MQRNSNAGAWVGWGAKGPEGPPGPMGPEGPPQGPCAALRAAQKLRGSKARIKWHGAGKPEQENFERGRRVRGVAVLNIIDYSESFIMPIDSE